MKTVNGLPKVDVVVNITTGQAKRIHFSRALKKWQVIGTSVQLVDAHIRSFPELPSVESTATLALVKS